MLVGLKNNNNNIPTCVLASVFSPLTFYNIILISVLTTWWLVPRKTKRKNSEVLSSGLHRCRTCTPRATKSHKYVEKGLNLGGGGVCTLRRLRKWRRGSDTGSYQHFSPPASSSDYAYRSASRSEKPGYAHGGLTAHGPVSK